MERCGKILDSDEDGLPSEVTDDVDGIFIPIPTESLELVAPVVPIYITADCFDSGDHDEATFDFDSGGLPCPDFQNHTTLLRYGDPLIYSGSGFTPLSDVHILLDDSALCTVQSDASGNINGSYWATFAEDMATYNDFFFITARDDVSGGFDYSIIELEGNSANLNCDTIVDWTDFAIFAAEWLSPDWPSYTGYCDQP